MCQTIKSIRTPFVGAFEGALLGLRVGSFETVGEVVGDKDGERLGLDEG